jgi:TPR repeat protein
MYRQARNAARPAQDGRPPPAHLPAVAVERRHPDQGGDLATGEEAELRQLRQQGPCAHRPDARHRAQQLLLGAPDRAKDEVEAAHWYRKAADQGHADA